MWYSRSTSAVFIVEMSCVDEFEVQTEDWQKLPLFTRRGH
jgi:hypothetical protein